MDRYKRIGVLTDFPENRTTNVMVEGSPVAIARWSGGVYAFEDRCTHADSPLTDVDIEDGQMECPLHGAKFSVTTGDALTLPATKPVKMLNVKLEEDTVFVELS